MNDNIHKDHRKRVKDEFLANGFLPTTPEHKILELILFYAIPRIDTNPLAHRLINTFGSLPDVFDAPISELVKVEGIGQNTALLLKTYLPVARRYFFEKRKEFPSFTSANAIGDFLTQQYLGLTEENLSLVALNTSGKLLDFKFLAKGDISTVGVSTRDVLKFALDSAATGIIMAHNHPGGIAVPSSADLEITRSLSKALKTVDILLLDHIILANGDYVSLRQSKKYCDIFA